MDIAIFSNQTPTEWNNQFNNLVFRIGIEVLDSNLHLHLLSPDEIFGLKTYERRQQQSSSLDQLLAKPDLKSLVAQFYRTYNSSEMTVSFQQLNNPMSEYLRAQSVLLKIKEKLSRRAYFPSLKERKVALTIMSAYRPKKYFLSGPSPNMQVYFIEDNIVHLIAEGKDNELKTTQLLSLKGQALLYV